MSNTPTIHVGTPPVGFDHLPEGHAVLCFHDLDVLDTKLGSFVESTPFCCIGGHQWKLRLYPGGTNNSATNAQASLELVNCSDSMFARVHLRVKKDWRATWTRKGKPLSSKMCELDCVTNFKSGQSHIWDDAFYFSDAAYLKNLTINVTIVSLSGVYVNNSIGNLSTLLGDTETSDVAFKTKDAILYAHKLVLKVQAPDLYDLCEQFDKEKPMSLDVDSRIFRAMLSTIYGSAMMAQDWTSDLKSILEAAGKYGFSDLKTEADKWYVDAIELTVDNVIDELLYADGQCLLFMKETAIDFIVNNAEQVIHSDSFEELYTSKRLVKEVMSALSRGKKSTIPAL